MSFQCDVGVLKITTHDSKLPHFTIWPENFVYVLFQNAAVFNLELVGDIPKSIYSVLTTQWFVWRIPSAEMTVFTVFLDLVHT